MMCLRALEAVRYRTVHHRDTEGTEGTEFLLFSLRTKTFT